MKPLTPEICSNGATSGSVLTNDENVTQTVSLPDEALLGLNNEEARRLERAWKQAQQKVDQPGLSGENAISHARGTLVIVAMLGLDIHVRLAAVLFCLGLDLDDLRKDYGEEVAGLVNGVIRLLRLGRPYSGAIAAEGDRTASDDQQQVETLRRMLLAMADDLRVVLLRLASRLQTLRGFAAQKRPGAAPWAKETLEVYAPLANRLGIWQIKWEMEDLAFRFAQPDAYRRIAQWLDEKRSEREAFVAQSIARLEGVLSALGVSAKVSGRPKHIYSIYNKMRQKNLDFDDLYDIRAFRVIVPEIRDCYTVLGAVHQLWQPLPKEFDDYIARPKENGYQSLHTVVMAEDGRAIEIQIRTEEMHGRAELGIAAHWKYKEGASAEDPYDARIAWLRTMLRWKLGGQGFAGESLPSEPETRIYVLTPQGRIVELPPGGTAIDFAYHVHTDLGHRCRGARVDGQLVPLDRPLQTGQTVEIIAAREGGPSRDWLRSDAKYLASSRARQKVRHYFQSLEVDGLLAEGRGLVEAALRREGQTALAFETLAERLGFARVEDLFLAAARDEVGPREIERAARLSDGASNRSTPKSAETVLKIRRPAPAKEPGGGVRVAGVGHLMTQLAKCCHPVPPDPIAGFVTIGRGVSVHRVDCPSLAHLRDRAPHRVIETQWDDDGHHSYPVALDLRVADRPGILRDLAEVFARFGLPIVDLRRSDHRTETLLRVTVNLRQLAELNPILAAISALDGVIGAQRS